MSNYNQLSRDKQARVITHDWVTRTCPLVYVFAPSGAGKTTWLSSLMKHPSYRPVLYIDADQGETTVEELTSQPELCIYRKFDQDPELLFAWFIEQLSFAMTESCGAILIEGLTSVHASMVSDKIAASPKAEKDALMRCYIEPSMRTSTAIEQIRKIKRKRIADGQGVPIIVTLNTKEVPEDQNKIDSGKVAVPEWSSNLTQKAMRGTEAFMRLSRTPTGTQLHTTTVGVKVRKAEVAAAIEQQKNLDAPGLFTLFATTIHEQSTTLASKLQPKTQEAESP